MYVGATHEGVDVDGLIMDCQLNVPSIRRRGEQPMEILS